MWVPDYQKPDWLFNDEFDVTFLSRDGVEAPKISGYTRARRHLFLHMNQNFHLCGGLVENIENGIDYFAYLTPDSVVVSVKTEYWHGREVLGLKVGLTSFVTPVDTLSKQLQKLCLDAVFENGYQEK